MSSIMKNYINIFWFWVKETTKEENFQFDEANTKTAAKEDEMKMQIKLSQCFF